MNDSPEPRFRRPLLAFLLFSALCILASLTASLVQSDFGRLSVTNLRFRTETGKLMRAKLLHPNDDSLRYPGIVYIHGYQNNRETSDPYAIELARRGFAVLEIDALGRGNSDNPGYLSDPGFDITYGGRDAVAKLRSLPMVDPDRIGIMGHSLGGEMAYTIAVSDPSIKAVAFSGFGYRDDADTRTPRNMLMIFGKYDEYRKRMTATADFERDFMTSPRTLAVFPVSHPEFDRTYGSFADGTARRVHMTRTTHVMESHSEDAVAEALLWMRDSLGPDPRFWIEADSQRWPLKEWATLIAMLACLAAVLPLADILLRRKLFSPLAGTPTGEWACPKRKFWLYTGVNTLFTWLYLPLVLVLFAVHLYLVPIDRVVPLMMANGIVFWFMVTNIAGFFIFLRWQRRRERESGFSLRDAGLSDVASRFHLSGKTIGLTLLLSFTLFLFPLLLELVLERLLIVDFRFVFPFASDLTLHRIPLVLLYLPFLFIGFLGSGILIHTQQRPAMQRPGFRLFLRFWVRGMAAVILPILTIVAVQYVPIFAGGGVPFTGPGASLVGFVINLFPIILKLVMATAYSSFLFLRTGSLYPGALLNSLVVAWMFASSQVIAPIPI